MKDSSTPKLSCCHKKPSGDPHLLCRRCRPCSFFTNECDVCETMSDDQKKETERTWTRSDARQSQLIRKKAPESTPTAPLDTTTSAVVSGTAEIVTSPVSPGNTTHRVDYLKSVDTAASWDATCVDSNMAAMAAENTDLRRRLARLETQPSPVPAQLPVDIFESPPRIHKFLGFDTEFISGTSFLPPPRAVTHTASRTSSQAPEGPVSSLSVPDEIQQPDIPSLFIRKPLLPTPCCHRSLYIEHINKQRLEV